MTFAGECCETVTMLWTLAFKHALMPLLPDGLFTGGNQEHLICEPGIDQPVTAQIANGLWFRHNGY